MKVEEFNCYACHTVDMCNRKCPDYERMKEFWEE
jgi:hypothetical protein